MIIKNKKINYINLANAFTSACITLSSSHTTSKTITLLTYWIVVVTSCTLRTFPGAVVLQAGTLSGLNITIRVRVPGTCRIAVARLTANYRIVAERTRLTAVAVLANHTGWASTIAGEFVASRTVAG